MTQQAYLAGIVPNKDRITRRICRVFFEQSGECQTVSRRMMVEAFAGTEAEETESIPSLITQAA